MKDTSCCGSQFLVGVLLFKPRQPRPQLCDQGVLVRGGVTSPWQERAVKVCGRVALSLLPEWAAVHRLGRQIHGRSRRCTVKAVRGPWLQAGHGRWSEDMAGGEQAPLTLWGWGLGAGRLLGWKNTIGPRSGGSFWGLAGALISLTHGKSPFLGRPPHQGERQTQEVPSATRRFQGPGWVWWWWRLDPFWNLGPRPRWSPENTSECHLSPKPCSLAGAHLNPNNTSALGEATAEDSHVPSAARC